MLESNLKYEKYFEKGAKQKPSIKTYNQAVTKTSNKKSRIAKSVSYEQPQINESKISKLQIAAIIIFSIITITFTYLLIHKFVN